MRVAWQAAGRTQPHEFINKGENAAQSVHAQSQAASTQRGVGRPTTCAKPRLVIARSRIDGELKQTRVSKPSQIAANMQAQLQARSAALSMWRRAHSSRPLPLHGPASCARGAVRAAAGHPSSNLANLKSFLTAAPLALGATPSAVVRIQRCIPTPRSWRWGPAVHTHRQHSCVLFFLLAAVLGAGACHPWQLYRSHGRIHWWLHLVRGPAV